MSAAGDIARLMQSHSVIILAAFVLAISCSTGSGDNSTTQPTTTQPTTTQPTTTQPTTTQPTTTQPTTTQPTTTQPTTTQPTTTQPTTTQPTTTQPTTTQPTTTQPTTTQAASRPTLDEALAALPSYKRGRDRAVLEVVAEHVKAAAGGNERDALEQRLLELLRSKATTDSKRFICSQLAEIGSARSVPLLSKLLRNKRLSHCARSVLTKMPEPAAGAALRAALGRVKGMYLIGVIDSVAARRDEEAVDALYGLVCRGNQSTRAAAIAALGKIGGAASADALAKACPKVPAMFRPAVAAARLRCGRGLVDAGKEQQAIRIYEGLALARERRVIRTAAIRSLVAIRPEKATRALAELLICEDPMIRAVARQYVIRLPSRDVTVALGQELPKLTVPGQVALLGALAARGDIVARPAVVKATASDSSRTRLAAIRALGRLGDATTVSLLAELAAGGSDNERDVARTSLQLMPGKAVDQAILWAMQAARPAMKVELIRSLAAREAKWAVPELIDVARDGDPSVRVQAFKALAALAEGDVLGELVGVLVKVKSDEVWPAAEDAVASCARRVADADRRARAVLAPMGRATIPARCSLLRVLCEIGGPRALAAVRSDTKHRSEQVRDAAIRSLAKWKSPSVAVDLMEIAGGPAKDEHHVLALRSYLGFAAAAAAKDPSASVRMYRKALSVARRLEDRKSILSALGRIHELAALETVTGYLAEQPTRDEAAASAVSICDTIACMHRHEVTAALQKVLKTSGSRKTRSRAKRVLDRLKRCQDYILVWQYAGPYGRDDKEATELLDVAFDPEVGREVRWQPIFAGAEDARPWAVFLSEVFKARNCVAYVRTKVWSPEACKARLEMGSDDGLKAWLNGREVHRTNQLRRITRGQDKVQVELAKGWNTLMLKVTQRDGEWAFCARLRSADGARLEGIRTEAN